MEIKIERIIRKASMFMIDVHAEQYLRIPSNRENYDSVFAHDNFLAVYQMEKDSLMMGYYNSIVSLTLHVINLRSYPDQTQVYSFTAVNNPACTPSVTATKDTVADYVCTLVSKSLSIFLSEWIQPRLRLRALRTKRKASCFSFYNY